MTADKAPTKIVFLCVMFPSLSQTFIFDQMAAIRAAGLPIEIVSLWKTQDPVQESVVQWRLMDHARFCLRNRGKAELVRQSAAAVFALLRQCPTALVGLIGLRRAGRSWKDLAWLLLFGAALLPLRDRVLIIANFGFVGRMAVDLRALNLLRGPIMTYFHGIDVAETPRKGGPNYYRDLFEQGESFLIASPLFRSQLVAQGCPENRIAYMPVGIDVTAFPYRTPAPRAPGATMRLITVARLTEKKGHRYVLDAIARLPADLAIQYDIVGDGPLLPDLQQQAQRLGIGEKIRFLGPQTRDAVVALLRGADVFVQPSVTTPSGDQEAIPVSLKEAMAMGLPVIASRHGAISNLIEDNTNGLLVPEHDATGIAEHIIHLIADPTLGPRLAQKARETIEDHWNNAILMRDFVARTNDLDAPTIKDYTA